MCVCVCECCSSHRLPQDSDPGLRGRQTWDYRSHSDHPTDPLSLSPVAVDSSPLSAAGGGPGGPHGASAGGNRLGEGGGDAVGPGSSETSQTTESE